MKTLIAIASALAMAASMPALAKPEGKGGGQGGEKSARGGGGGGGGGGKALKAERGGGGGVRVARIPRGERRAERQERRIERGPQLAERQAVRAERRARRAPPDRQERVAARRNDRALARSERRGSAQQVDIVNRNIRWDRRGERDGFGRGEPHYNVRPARVTSFAQACPSGLAKKNELCLPPGQARKVFAVGERLNDDWYGRYNVPLSYRAFYPDSSEYTYRYDDGGYIYQVDRQGGLVSSLIPLLGGGFGIGQALPAGYDAYNLPMQYRDTYADSEDAYYRYGDNAIYEVDPQTSMIESIVALLTGDGLGVGQMLPEGYDTYNLPLDYRDQYVDSDEAMYRYADGNIYQADPQTGIIEQIISGLI